MRYFACVTHAPDVVAKWLSDNLALAPTDFHMAETSVNKKRVQMFLGYSSFVKLHKQLPHKSEALAVVFCTPIQAYSWNLLPLDYLESEEPHLNAFEYHELDKTILRGPPMDLVYESRPYLNKIVELVGSFESLLHELMSFIYTMKTPEQKTAKEAACRFLARGLSLEQLRRELNALNDRQIERMIQMLSNDVAQRIQQAFADTKLSIEERVKKYNVSAYELRYIESVNKKVT